MNDPLHRPTSNPPARLDRRALVVTAVVAALVCGLIAFVQSRSDSPTASAAEPPSADDGSADLLGVMSPAGDVTLEPATGVTAASTLPAAATAVDPAAPTAVAAGDVDLDGGADTQGTGCILDRMSIRSGDSGPAVICLQQALVAAGYLTGSPTGTFDTATYGAVRELQTAEDMFVDGIVGRETALFLGIWPDENALVVRTPIPAAGATDLMGYTLSSVAVSGDDPNMPPLPANSGSGKRLVYDRAGQRVWAVDRNDRVVRSWLVSGSKYSNEVPGVHEVYSRSEYSTAWNGKAILPRMVRWLKTKIGHIGFHGIPRHVEDNSRYQTDAELGTRLSGGCQRQADLDAAFLWDFAQIGTKVVVL